MKQQKNCLRSKKADPSGRNMGMAVQHKYMKVGWILQSWKNLT